MHDLRVLGLPVIVPVVTRALVAGAAGVFRLLGAVRPGGRRRARRPRWHFRAPWRWLRCVPAGRSQQLRSSHCEEGSGAPPAPAAGDVLITGRVAKLLPTGRGRGLDRHFSPPAMPI